MQPKGSQFVTLYRGLMDPDDDAVLLSKRTRDLGQHWTTDKSVAERFASFDENGYETPGQIITAQVHNRHIVRGAERRMMGATHGVHGEGSGEAEQPLRKGAIVHIQSVEHLHEDGTVERWRGSDVEGVFGQRRIGRV